ncbi:MAG: HlyD family efflux transporter periplasmic adaptor subunit, partial [Myxococcales bacterium]|nr:HlyD family efflux transporter periplasmic adaptor subunit [Myxococcales bacterium]
GDEVEEGGLIAALDATELELEKVQWQTRRAQTRKEQRQARARREYAEAKILAARLAQADAELAALEVQIERSRLVAPFHGVIVKGDLSQSLGAPVERGEVLFEIAPLDSYRVTLQVDERDIAHIAVGQNGRLALTALPHKQHPFRVERVTPMASAEDGRNFFRVEAGLTGDALGLRPGMEGVAKIEIGDRSLLWVATHRAADWFRLVTWGWWL